MNRLAPILFACVIAPVTAADGAKSNAHEDKALAERTLVFCKQAAREYPLFLGEDRLPLEFHLDPVLRWSNPSAGTIYGGVFLWTYRDRPAAVASIYRFYHPHNHAAFEVHSLVPDTLVATFRGNDAWTPPAGPKFETFPDAPQPASTATARLGQMRALARGFAVQRTARDKQQQEMRLMAQPLYRYSSEHHHAQDGAVFNFTDSTDPEVLLLIEAQTAERPHWQYMLARMNSSIFTAKYRDKEVWRVEELPWDTVFDAKGVYNILKLDHLVAEAEAAEKAKIGK